MDKIFLRTLLETASPSGYEQNAATLWKREAEKITQNVHGDVHGNSIAVISSAMHNMVSSRSPNKIMLAGHIDEIGFIISYISDEGFIYFKEIGGWDPQILPGQRVKIFAKNDRIIKGCIGRTPVHLLSGDAVKQVVKIEDLWIDVGGKNNADFVSVGDCAVIDYPPEFYENNILAARGIDDRIGAFIILEALKIIERDKIENIICAVATVQEEIGLRGAITSAYGIKPRVGIAVDVTFASDYPRAKKERGNIKLGKGPVIAIGPNITPSIYNLLVETAKESSIPYQVEAQPRGTGTDANAIQLSSGGVATGIVSIPNRYMHSPCELVDLNDAENAIKLLARFCEKDIGRMTRIY